MSSNFSKVESYVAETIVELNRLGIDHSPFFPLPKTLVHKIVNKNKAESYLCFNDSSDRKKLKGLWKHMIDRCHDSTNSSFKTHGGKGTKVCDEWLKDFDKFYDWATSNGYKFGLSLDRIDNSKGYQPDNARWANHTVQARNRSNLVKYDAFGESKLLIEWANDKRCLVSYECLKSRKKAKWDLEKAITEPSKKK